MIIKTRKIRNIPLLLYDKKTITLTECHSLLALVAEDKADEILNTMYDMGINYGLAFGMNVDDLITIDTKINVLINREEKKEPINLCKSIW